MPPPQQAAGEPSVRRPGAASRRPSASDGPRIARRWLKRKARSNCNLKLGAAARWPPQCVSVPLEARDHLFYAAFPGNPAFIEEKGTARESARAIQIVCHQNLRLRQTVQQVDERVLARR